LHNCALKNRQRHVDVATKKGRNPWLKYSAKIHV
jgi:hypothetical protein